MKEKNIIRVAISLLLAATMLTVTLAGCGSKTDGQTTAPATEPTEAYEMTYYTDAPSSVDKTETVYVNLDSAGTVKSTIVSDWLHTDKACVKVNDFSDLENIINIKSNVPPVYENKGLTWHMDSTDLYYRGSSSKALPVTVSVKYYLNGKELTAQQLAGQSGEVKIVVTTKNNVSRTVKIDGKDEKIYSPFVMVGGMILAEDKFTGVTVENGKTIGDGSKEIALLIGAPGMNENLELDKLDLGELDLSFADTFTISASVTDFELGNMYFAVLPLSTLISDMEIPDTVTDLKETLNQLDTVQEALSSLNPEQLIDTLVSSGDKVKEFTAMISKAVNLYETNKALLEAMPKYLTEENIAAFTKLLNDIDSANLNEVYKLVSNPVMQTFLKGLPELAKDLSAIMPIVESFQQDMNDPGVQAALDALPETLKQLAEIQTKLNENKELIDTLTDLLSQENIDKVNNLLESLQGTDIADKLAGYGVLADNADTLIARVSAMLAPESEYSIFTKAADNVNTSVMFVYQTPSVTKSTTK